MRWIVMVLSALLLVACIGPGDDDELLVWFHTGKPSERAAMEAMVADYNASDPPRQVRLVCIPEQGYHDRIETAAQAGRLPDVLDFDGPYLASLAWKGILQPIPDHQELVDNLLPSLVAQGTWRDQVYGLGQFDSGLGLYARRSALTAIGARIPDGVADAWSVDEFEEILRGLAERGERQVLDLKLNYGGEWFTYAFSPIIQSAGADLVSRATPVAAVGTLDAPQAVAAMSRLQSWIAEGYVHPNADDNAFISGAALLSWCGHWVYEDYARAHGDDLVVLPLPDFGTGSRTGMGSWCWGITRSCRDVDAARHFLTYILGDDRILAMTAANAAVPATATAAAQSSLHGPDGPLALFTAQLSEAAVPRPVSPAYPVITQVFQDAFARIRRGEDVAEVLAEAAVEIDREVADNQGYPSP